MEHNLPADGGSIADWGFYSEWNDGDGMATARVDPGHGGDCNDGPNASQYGFDSDGSADFWFYARYEQGSTGIGATDMGRYQLVSASGGQDNTIHGSGDYRYLFWHGDTDKTVNWNYKKRFRVTVSTTGFSPPDSNPADTFLQWYDQGGSFSSAIGPQTGNVSGLNYLPDGYKLNGGALVIQTNLTASIPTPGADQTLEWVCRKAYFINCTLSGLDSLPYSQAAMLPFETPGNQLVKVPDDGTVELSVNYIITTPNYRYECVGYDSGSNTVQPSAVSPIPPDSGRVKKFITLNASGGNINWLYQRQTPVTVNVTPSSLADLANSKPSATNVPNWVRDGSVVTASVAAVIDTGNARYVATSWTRTISSNNVSYQGSGNSFVFTNDTASTISWLYQRSLIVRVLFDGVPSFLSSSDTNVVPPAGESSVYQNNATNCIAPAIINDGTTRYVLLGWIGSGNVPPSGFTNDTAGFTATSDSTITWRYRTEHALDVIVLDPERSDVSLSIPATGRTWYIAGAQASASTKHIAVDDGTNYTMLVSATSGAADDSVNTVVNGRDTRTFTMDAAATVTWSYRQTELWNIGEPILPPPNVDSNSLPNIQIVVSTVPGTTNDNSFWFGGPAGDKRLYPLRPIASVILTWQGATNVTVGGLTRFSSSNLQTHVAGVPISMATRDGSNTVVAIKYQENDATLANSTFTANQSGKSLIQFAAGTAADAANHHSVFVTVDTKYWDDVSIASNATWEIGTPITNEFHDEVNGRNGYVYMTNSFYDASIYSRDTRQGPIIPVNEDKTPYDYDQMVVAWYSLGSPTLGIYWPTLPVKYTCQWPASNVVPRVYIASQKGVTVDLPQVSVYNQPNAKQPGFNPNEEHAGIYDVGGEPTMFALRNDLNVLSTNVTPFSLPYVLVKYKDDILNDWRMQVYKVETEGGTNPATGGPYTFNYPVTAGLPVFPPYPLSVLPAQNLSSNVGGKFWYFQDHKGGHWAKAAGVGTNVAKIAMQWYYPMQPGFYYPDFNNDGSPDIAQGQPVALLSKQTDLQFRPPTNVNYIVSWPTSDVAVLSVGETLLRAKKGLPSVFDMSCAEVIYDENFYKGGGPLVKLLDPLSERWVTLLSLPADIKTETVGARKRFSDLPYYLKNRLSYDPLNKRLYMNGVYDESGAGEPLVLLNVLSLGERQFLQSFNSGWVAAIGLLYDNCRNPNGVLTASTIYNPMNGTQTIAAAYFSTNTWGAYLGLQSGPTGSVKEAKMLGVPKALTAGSSRGTGWVTLVENNDDSLGAAPVALHVIRVDGEPYQGEIKVIASDNVFDEKVTLRHSGDFGGEPDRVNFSWYYKPDTTGFAPDLPANVVNPSLTGWVPLASGLGLQEITIQGASPLTISDNWIAERYNYGTAYPYVSGISTPYSRWAGSPGGQKAQLAEGWIKRVVAGLNPFDARVTDYHAAPVNTIVSMIAQAGPRYEGAVAFSPSACNLNNLGMIEAYQTVLNRGLDLSVNSGINYGPANSALQNISTRLADFYTLLGNEAYQDALDPLIGFGTSSGAYGSLAPAIFAFQNQVPSLLDEELVLMRGRDDSATSTRIPPVYNRFFWNFTHGDGEVAYAQTYNISDQITKDSNNDGCPDVADGVINEDDAKYLYPQGHGDAWGHYLTALTFSYKLLRNPNYTWESRSESVLVGGVPIAVDYLDERKFAETAAKKAQVGGEIVNLTYRSAYVDDPEGQWQGYKDTDPSRAWGLDEWARRAGQGAYFDWVVANAMLPSVDPNTNHTGIAKIDRTTITPLKDIASRFQDIQSQIDNADKGMNPLGLAKGVVPFDIDPSKLVAPDAGAELQTHFEQIYNRALSAMQNAVDVFDYANQLSQMIRQNQDTLQDQQKNIGDQERDYMNRLIEIFGYPYADDIGAAKTYPSGYDGPDWIHYMYVEPSELTGKPIPPVSTYNVTYNFSKNDGNFDAGLGLSSTQIVVGYTFTSDGTFMVKPPDWTGTRRAPGEIQMALSDLIQAKANLQKGMKEYDVTIKDIERAKAMLEAQYNQTSNELAIYNSNNSQITSVEDEIKSHHKEQLKLARVADSSDRVFETIIEGIPKTAGIASSDVCAPARGALYAAKNIIGIALNTAADAEDVAELGSELDKEKVQRATDYALAKNSSIVDLQERRTAVAAALDAASVKRLEVSTLKEQVEQAVGRYLTAVASGVRLLDERAAFRRQTAPEIQDLRYQDMTFRTFRNDALQKFRAMFDLAARYVFMAATAYDYETNLLGTDNASGRTFLTDIIRQRNLGQMINGNPVAGQPGLADALARMKQNFAVYKTQMGFNNPATETSRFSLRKELFRIKTNDVSDAVWRQTLQKYRIDDLNQLPEFNRFCRPFAPTDAGPQPAIVIPFSTYVQFGQNFFGWPLAGGDSTYDPTHFATKIRTAGIWFDNYDGQGLSFTPRVYLIPTGLDVMRSPSGDTLATREWKIIDQKIPVPFPIGQSDMNDPNLIPINDSLSDTFAGIRRFSRLRAYHDSGDFDPAETTTDSRLIGRSVWNTQWLLIIPGETLLNPAGEGLDAFIGGQPIPGTDQRDGNGVKDIKVFFQTYSYSGN